MLYVEGGHNAARIMDDIEEFDRKQIQLEELEEAGVDTMYVPEGMSIREVSMGVIPADGG